MNERLFKDNSKGAIFSDCGRYRYQLWRIWDEDLPKVMCVGLNPSTANETKTDPTITHLTLALKKLGYGGFYMVNLFAWISSEPKDLLTCGDPLGDNNQVLQDVSRLCDEVIFAWGKFKEADGRIREVIPMFPHAKCFGYNKDGSPMHPLYLMYSGKSKNPQLINYAKED